RRLLGLRRSEDPGHVPRHVGDGDRDREPADPGAARVDARTGARVSRRRRGDRRRAGRTAPAAGWAARRRLLQSAHRPRHAPRARLGQLLSLRGAARAGRAAGPREDRLGGSDGATQDRLHSHRGRNLLQGSAGGGHPRRGARLRLGVDGGAPRGHQSLLALAVPGAAGFATRTSKVMLGTDIAVAAFYHPVRLAEDVAMLDVMSNGRITLGVAIGYKPDEFALYGVDLEKRGARFEEQLAIMKGLWTQERFAFKGTYYT